MNLSDLLILLIEPSRVQRHIIMETLKEIGITDIEEFDAALPALEQMSTIKPDIVMSSMHLPDMLGTEVVHRMRSTEGLSDITFMLISSETHYRYLEPIRQAGAIAILPKPFKPEDMKRALQSTMHYIFDDGGSEHAEDFFLDSRVLVVDDSALSRRFIRQTLEHIGVGLIMEASDGAEALKIMEQQRFDLIISDYNMPNVDGIELVEHIRRESNQQAIPVMMVTSEQNESRLAAIERSGVSALCSKPLSYDMMKQMIEQIIADSTEI